MRMPPSRHSGQSTHTVAALAGARRAAGFALRGEDGQGGVGHAVGRLAGVAEGAGQRPEQHEEIERAGADGGVEVARPGQLRRQRFGHVFAADARERGIAQQPRGMHHAGQAAVLRAQLRHQRLDRARIGDVAAPVLDAGAARLQRGEPARRLLGQRAAAGQHHAGGRAAGEDLFRQQAAERAGAAGEQVDAIGPPGQCGVRRRLAGVPVAHLRVRAGMAQLDLLRPSGVLPQGRRDARRCAGIEQHQLAAQPRVLQPGACAASPQAPPIPVALRREPPRPAAAPAQSRPAPCARSLAAAAAVARHRPRRRPPAAVGPNPAPGSPTRAAARPPPPLPRPRLRTAARCGARSARGDSRGRGQGLPARLEQQGV